MPKTTEIQDEVLAEIKTARADNGFVEFGVEITKNLGNYENVKVHTAAGRPLRDGEHPREAFDKLYETVTNALDTLLTKAVSELRD